MSGIGTIDAGSSVALTGATAEIIQLLNKLQEDQLQASIQASKSQSDAACMAADATRNSGQQAANSMYCEAAMSAFSALTSGASAYSSIKSISSMNALKTNFDLESKNLNLVEAELNGKLTANVGTDTAEEAKISVADIKADIASGKTTNLSKYDEAVLSDPEKADVQKAIATRREELNRDLSLNQNLLSQKAERNRYVGEFGNATVGAVTKGVAGYYQKEKAQYDATAQIANMATQQSGQVFSDLIQARAKVADEISQIIQAKDAAISTLANSVRA